VNPSQLRAFFRRHLVAVLAVMVLAVGVAWDIRTTPLTYEEDATVALMAPGNNPYALLGHQLIPMASLMTTTITSTAYVDKIRAAGGTATAEIAMVNLYNEQFPVYGVPFIQISTESSDPAAVNRTFDIVVQTLRDLMSARQAQAGVPRASFISMKVVGDSGVQTPDGSHIRVLAGLAILTLMVLFLVVTFLDRRRPRRAPFERRLSLGLPVRLP
jgi:hypothetical protein